MEQAIIDAIKASDERIEELSLDGGRTTGVRLRLGDTGDAPLVISIHGGGGIAWGAVVPGASELGKYADLGMPGFALNRPGYGGSEWPGIDPTVDDRYFPITAERFDDALAEIWERFGGASRGIIVHGASTGGAIAIMLAARWGRRDVAGEAQRWPLLGISVTDVGHDPSQRAIDVWKSTRVVDFFDDLLLQLLDNFDLGPSWCRVEIPRTTVAELTPRVEATEISSGGWPRIALGEASAVTVPVRYRLGEFDPLWKTGDEQIAELAAAFRTRSPYVDAARVDGASHGIGSGPRGRSEELWRFSFLELCRAVAAEPRLVDRTKR
ncbi:alpha/beta hydrolase family protein [Microbacterium sp. No. 7]|uniref:alpha/beta hydrolase family protein n=1 Tax=Microbacterium sp. No. 7 TaxID=1714373 RepID=UPI0006D0ED55|nr:alpha/beta hydrolase [Microbacterium sp. No. 7]ALJ20068.1 hypothetical protein AOA12_09160 [Microbacterium sp. No. 7]